LQDRDRRLSRSGRRLLRHHRITARRDGILRSQRRRPTSLSLLYTRAELRKPPGPPQDGRRRPDRRRGGVDGKYRFCVGGRGPMKEGSRTFMRFSAELEARLAELTRRYPSGYLRGAMVPMLLYIQDEVGAITDDVVEEVAGRLNLTSLQVNEV